MTGLIPRSLPIVIPGAAHAVTFDAPQALVEAVLLFFTDLPELARSHQPEESILPTTPC